MKKPARKVARKPAKPAKVTAKAPARQHSTSASGTLTSRSRQHRATGKGTLKPPAPKKITPKKRQWSPGADVACCAAEAYGTLVAASGRPWNAEQTLALYRRTARDPSAGASIEDTLKAAGLVEGPGFYPSWRHSITRPPRSPSLIMATGASPLILGIALPEPHAVAVTPDGTWWSWGELFNPGDWPELVVDEAWAVLL